jgi:hypothetical protein
VLPGCVAGVRQVYEHVPHQEPVLEHLAACDEVGGTAHDPRSSFSTRTPAVEPEEGHARCRSRLFCQSTHISTRTHGNWEVYRVVAAEVVRRAPRLVRSRHPHARTEKLHALVLGQLGNLESRRVRCAALRFTKGDQG